MSTRTSDCGSPESGSMPHPHRSFTRTLPLFTRMNMRPLPYVNRPLGWSMRTNTPAMPIMITPFGTGTTGTVTTTHTIAPISKEITGNISTVDVLTATGSTMTAAVADGITEVVGTITEADGMNTEAVGTIIEADGMNTEADGTITEADGITEGRI